MNLDSREAFLQLYPTLTEEQRQGYLNQGYLPAAIYEKQKLSDPYWQRRKPLSLRIEGPEKITSGGEQKLRAVIRFNDGKEADATQDVTWSVTPASVSVSEGKIWFGCINAPVLVTANFFKERQVTRTIEIRKPLAKLVLERSDPSASSEETPVIGMRAIAQCTDGSSTDVTCQADWNLSHPEAAISGCGLIRGKENRTPHPDQATVSARYGNQESRILVRFPRLGLRPALQTE